MIDRLYTNVHELSKGFLQWVQRFLRPILPFERQNLHGVRDIAPRF